MRPPTDAEARQALQTIDALIDRNRQMQRAIDLATKYLSASTGSVEYEAICQLRQLATLRRPEALVAHESQMPDPNEPSGLYGISSESYQSEARYIDTMVPVFCRQCYGSLDSTKRESSYPHGTVKISRMCRNCDKGGWFPEQFYHDKSGNRITECTAPDCSVMPRRVPPTAINERCSALDDGGYRCKQAGSIEIACHADRKFNLSAASWVRVVMCDLHAGFRNVEQCKTK